MKHIDRRNICSRLFAFVAVAMFAAVVCGLAGAGAGEPAADAKQADSPIIAECKSDLAQRLSLPLQDIALVETQAVTWPDTALGLPETGKIYAQVLTPGFRVILEARGSRYLYTTSAKAFRYGGPISIWACSMLYLMPVENEPNLNGDLYQCSLLGTNSIRVASGVADYYPQEQGVIIIKRRTSRSSHKLLYVKADGTADARTLHSAFDFGDAAVNDAQDRWAGFVRPRIGDKWSVVVAGIDQNAADKQTLPLPDGVETGQIAWSDEQIMILVKRGERTVCFETSPKSGAPEWKEVSTHLFPGLPDFPLNKSEWLEVDQVTKDGKPCVEVASVWFTGDRNVIAQVEGLTMEGYDRPAGRYVFIWGKKGSETTAYTVDIKTGEVILSYSGDSPDVKPFAYPPARNPMPGPTESG